METSLHKQLKTIYAGDDARQEVALGQYRIDVVSGQQLVEIQNGSLAAIRDKVRTLVREHAVLVVKPIVANKQIVKLADRDGRVISRRKSPKRGTFLDVFDELVYFTRVFPHKNLVLEVPLVEIEEWRYPGHGRRRRRRSNDFQVQDQRLVRVAGVTTLHTAGDLRRLIDCPNLPHPFHTGHLAEALGVQRWVAQRIAYCFRKMGTAKEVGKKGNSILYEFPKTATRRRKADKSAPSPPPEESARLSGRSASRHAKL